MATPRTTAMRRSAATALWLLLAATTASCVRPSEAEEVDSGATVDDGGTCTGTREGCACDDEGATEACYPDAPIVDGERICLMGQRSCRHGQWGSCENVHEFEPESRTGVAVAAASDDPFQCASCEPRCFRAADTIRSTDVAEHGMGLVFDPTTGGATNPGSVATCMLPSCTSSSSRGAGTGSPWMPTSTNSDGVTVDPSDGALVLGVLGLNSPGVWVSNMDDGTVSRLDPATGREIGRYVSARPDFVNRARPWNESCNWSNTGNCPSRTAVDQNFDCYVANRAFGNQGTVTKIAARLERCVDRNANGRIDTSTDANGDGRIDKTSATEFPGVNDECVLWTVPVGVNNGIPRALAIGVAPSGTDVGDVWVGNYNERRAYRLRPSDGAVLSNISISPINPYGAVADANGRIWFYARAGGTNRVLGRVNTSTTPVTFTEASRAPYNAVGYGITYYRSEDGTREYLFAADSDGARVLRYDIRADSWIYTNVTGTPRGVAADTSGNVWVANYQAGNGWTGSCSRNLWRFDTSLGGFTSYTAPSASCFMGIGVTFDNAIWGIAAGGSKAARLAPTRTSWIETPSLFVSPYTYSDFIGYGLNVFANPRGHYQFTTDGGASCARQRWTAVNWTATTPTGTTVAIYVRSSDTEAGLATQAWLGPFNTSPADLTRAPGPVPNGRYLEIDVRMETSDRRITPRVSSVAATGYCDPVEYGTGGTYTRVYDSTSTEDSTPATVICDPVTEAPIWGQFVWDATVPTGTSIRFEFRTANSRAGLATATPAYFDVPPNSSPFPSISNLLRSSGLPMQLPYLQVTARLTSSSDRRSTPTLRNFSQEFTCMPAF